MKLLNNRETMVVNGGSCDPSFDLYSIGDSCTSSGQYGTVLKIEINGYTGPETCELWCQGQSMGYIRQGNTASCMSGQMAKVVNMQGGNYECSGTASHV